ncbi:DUF3035 domain-containing protein [Tropicibacter naphthalenivorans]|uniref:Beta-barrel assembly machine subunit BamF n=1 Tax=Tropicibacter naphthalenivorans TaxID=441103 RepID=A0A0P1G1H8_9RHOB|nr:DUF3035 domain-containing protein [Tropicibacter naphthalenivorans]CUH75490.1 hypothetical protein TRN7648_00467 [Tropicibacter naphthalenivorans]SMC44147.1 Beta-barrel assembly machine subunit BamF [Tropicibacter naphthalenivorans]
MRASHLVAFLALGALTACSGYERDITLHDLRTNSGQPEEFAIVPHKPLTQPETYADLPTPTPGGANRTDATPLADAVAVLGGNPARVQATGQGVPSGDVALVRSASRFGRDGQIREELAATDLEFRKRRSLFTWSIVPRDEYTRAYRRETLDGYTWLERYRAAGAGTPSAPPE